MNKLKYLSAALLAAALAGAIAIACSKKDNPTPAAEGKKAGQEMCDCVTSMSAPDPTVLTDPAALQAAFVAYAAKLQDCLAVIAKYEAYVTVNMAGYTPFAAEPLLSVFAFTDNDFKDGFAEGVGTCSAAFASLWALMPSE